MKKDIEFQTSTTGKSNLISPLSKPQGRFDCSILTPQHAHIKARLPEGTCTVRVLPTIKDSEHWWLPISALCYPEGQHAHPQSIDPNAFSIFDHARAWFRQNAPKALYTKASGKGFKLWTQPMAVSWILVTHDGETNLRLLLASGFTGTRVVQPGLGYQFMRFVQKNQELLDPGAKSAIEVTRASPTGSRYLNTELRLVESDLSLDECIADLPSEQIRLVCPVEQTIRQITQDEEWKLLEKAIGTQWADKIRNSSQTIT